MAQLRFGLALAGLALFSMTVGLSAADAPAAGDAVPELPMNAAPLAPETPAPSVSATDKPLASAPGAFAQGQPSPKAGDIVGDWKNAEIKGRDGIFSYCYAAADFSNGLGLMIARNASGESNIGVIIPNGQLPQGKILPVQVQVDNGQPRMPRAVAAQPDRLVIALGKDDALFDALRTGRVLLVQGPGDKATFNLKKAGKALLEVKSCVDKAVAAGGPALVAKASLPEALRSLLTQAGLGDITPIPLDNMKPEERPANFMWHLGPIVGGVREGHVDEKTELPTLVNAYSDALKKQCKGDFNFVPDNENKFPAVTIQNAAVTCAMPDKKIYAALLFYLTAKGKIFTVFFHQGADSDKDMAIKARDAIGKVILDVAARTPAPAETPKASDTEQAPPVSAIVSVPSATAK